MSAFVTVSASRPVVLVGSRNDALCLREMAELLVADGDEPELCVGVEENQNQLLAAIDRHEDGALFVLCTNDPSLLARSGDLKQVFDLHASPEHRWLAIPGGGSASSSIPGIRRALDHGAVDTSSMMNVAPSSGRVDIAALSSFGRVSEVISSGSFQPEDASSSVAHIPPAPPVGEGTGTSLPARARRAFLWPVVVVGLAVGTAAFSLGRTTGSELPPVSLDVPVTDKPAAPPAAILVPTAPAPPTPSPGFTQADLVAKALAEGRIRRAGGLVIRNPKVTRGWYGAMALCKRTRHAGLRGWRVPELTELRALWRARVIRSGTYWSAGKANRDGTRSFVLEDGKPRSKLRRDTQAGFICVRSAEESP